ncbi:MAG: ABC transporter permease subunit [Eubacteriaceae bacterium]|nr:ABC transporter permease subunit [Eubacteriaceae bacterium]
MSDSDYKKVPAELIKQRRLYAATIAFIAVLYITASIQTNYNPLRFFFHMGSFFDFLVHGLLPPSYKLSEGLGAILAQNFGMALIPTFIGGLIAFCLCFFASYSTAPNRVSVKIVRALASFQRNLPSSVWLMVLVMAFGVGTSVGLMALTINTLGYLLRGFADVVDEVGNESMEAIDSVGAAYLPKLFQCVIPAALPGFISWLLYAIEINIMSSSIIGAVGGGGIGMVLMSHWKLFRYRTSFGIILVLAANVIAVNFISNYLREKVIK